MGRLITPPIRKEVQEFHNSQIVIDLHVDILLQKKFFGYDLLKSHEPWKMKQPLFRHADIPRMKEGGYSLACLGVHYWPWESKRAWKVAQKQIRCMEDVLELDSSLTLFQTASDLEKVHVEGGLALCFGLEGAHILGRELKHLEEARQRGCLYMTLVHFNRNSAATPGYGFRTNPQQGLSSFGRELIQTLEENEIIVDVSHVNSAGVLDACQIAKKPVIATHSCCYSLFPTERGLYDEGIQAIAQTNGVIGIIFSPHFLCGSKDMPLEKLTDHIHYVGNLVGYEHLAIGTDFDGWIPSIPNDIRDCRDLAYLTQLLLDQGLSQEVVSGILGQNMLRVIREVRTEEF